MQRCLIIDDVRGIFHRAIHYLTQGNKRKLDEIFKNNGIQFFFEDYQSVLLYERTEHYDCDAYYSNQINPYRKNYHEPTPQDAMKIRGLGKKKTRLLVEFKSATDENKKLLNQAIQLINLGFFRIGGMKSRGFGLVQIN